MDEDTYPVELATLVEIGKLWDVRITAKWLSKRMNQGLLPRHARALGLGRAAGRENARYSKEVEAQLPALLNALKVHGKNLAAVGWDLWWHGWSVDQHYWRAPMMKVALQWTELKSLFPTSDSVDTSNADLVQRVSVELVNRRNAGPLVGAIKRHASGQLSDFLEIIVSVLNGSHVPLGENPNGEYESELLSLFGKSLSLPISDALIPADSQHFAISAEALDGELNKIARFANINVDAHVASLSDREIEVARNEISLLVHAVVRIEKLTSQNTGRSSGAQALTWSVVHANGQAALLVGWLLLRHEPQMHEGIAQLNKIVVDQIKSIGGADNVLETRPHIFRR